ncbi:MAG: phage major capsid protein [Acidimicrobiia bacterium]
MPMNTAELRNERGRVLNEIDDILETARSQNLPTLPPAELAEHDYLVRRLEELNRSLGDHDPDVSRSRTPGINRIGGASPAASRSLDDLLWASPESVPAMSVGRSGLLVANPYGAHNPVPAVAVRSEGGVPVYAPRLDEIAPSQQGAVRRFQRTVTDMILFGLLVDDDVKSSKQGFEVARSHPAMRDRWNSAVRAMDVDTAAEGQAWVPTGIGADLHEKVRAAGKIAPLFARINMPTNPWKWPIEGADATAYRVAEPTGDTETKMTASTPGSLGVTFDAEIFGARALFSRSLEPDSAVAIMPYVRGKIVQAFSDAEEKAILDGDTDGTHQDSDVGASTTDTRTAWDGLRKRALANASTDASNAALTVTLIKDLRAKMGKWGLNPGDLAIILSVNSYYDLLGDSNLLTVDKLGPQAVILNGQLGQLFGAPVIVSEHVRENLNASGVHDGITTNRTYALVVNRQEWAVGQRMALDVEADDSIYRETFQRVLVGFSRVDVQNIGDASTNDDTAVLFNVAP